MTRAAAAAVRPWEGKRVALVHDWLNGMRGGEKVFEALCELFPDATVFTLFYEPSRVSERIRRMRVVESGLGRLPGARSRYRWLLPLFPRAVEQFPTADFDLVVSSSHCVAKAAHPPARGGGAHICYCHTPMRYIWDAFDIYFPREGAECEVWADAPLGGGAGDPRNPAIPQRIKRMALRRAALALRPRLRRWDRATASRVDEFLANSRNVARKIHRYYGRRARVIPPPVDCEFFTPGPSAFAAASREPYDLVVSALVPYKRVELAIAAARRSGRRLVIAGDGPGRRRRAALAAPGVEFLGWVDDETLRDLYRGARSLIYPQEEDFGITALEAQACGRPVVALGRGGALETVERAASGGAGAGRRARNGRRGRHGPLFQRTHPGGPAPRAGNSRRRASAPRGLPRPGAALPPRAFSGASGARNRTDAGRTDVNPEDSFHGFSFLS